MSTKPQMLDQNMPDGFGYANSGGPVLAGTFNTFAGTDMTIFFGNREVGTLMSLTVSIAREVVPIYTTSSANPRAFAKGKRAISGSMVFGQFDRHAILEGIFQDLTKVTFEQNLAGNERTWGDTSTDLLDVVSQDPRRKAYSRNYSDQMPPFDVVVTMINEEGAAAAFAVRDVVLVNEGFGMTVDDITQEMACSYVAKSVVRMTPIYRKTPSPVPSLLGSPDPYPRGWS